MGKPLELWNFKNRKIAATLFSPSQWAYNLILTPFWSPRRRLQTVKSASPYLFNWQSYSTSKILACKKVENSWEFWGGFATHAIFRILTGSNNPVKILHKARHHLTRPLIYFGTELVPIELVHWTLFNFTPTTSHTHNRVLWSVPNLSGHDIRCFDRRDETIPTVPPSTSPPFCIKSYTTKTYKNIGFTSSLIWISHQLEEISLRGFRHRVLRIVTHTGIYRISTTSSPEGVLLLNNSSSNLVVLCSFVSHPFLIGFRRRLHHWIRLG